MKPHFVIRFIIVAISLFSAIQSANAQVYTNFYSQYYVQEDTVFEYESENEFPCIFIPSDFAQDFVRSQQKFDSLKNCAIIRIDLAYSLFKTDKHFDQQKLNLSRWNALINNYPDLFVNAVTGYYNVCQSVASTSEEAMKLKHGFFVYYTPVSDSVLRGTELESMNFLISQLEKPSSGSSAKTHELPVGHEPAIVSKQKKISVTKRKKSKDPNACRSAFFGNLSTGYGIDDYLNELKPYHSIFQKKQKIKLGIVVNQYGTISSIQIPYSSSRKFTDRIVSAMFMMGAWNPAYAKRRFQKSTVELVINYDKVNGYSVDERTLAPKFICECGAIDDDSIFIEEKPITSTGGSSNEIWQNNVVYSVLKRIGPRKNSLMIMDVTGSMYPYIESALKILSDTLMSKHTNLKAMVVFNDGDNRKDRFKEAGKTGGVYYSENNDPVALAKFISNAMHKGGGGDCPENNIEATIKGIESCSDCNDIIMIADNFATPRDTKLIEQVSKPIHWILCGFGECVNPEYLDLIRANKGFGHTFHSDFYGLESLKNGDSVEIDGVNYQLSDGKFRIRAR